MKEYYDDSNTVKFISNCQKEMTVITDYRVKY